ncbi:MAG: accessory gene regulator B family protein [Lachnospiraceae bacterium]|nr:accessory gene regulator B family protein [Lachnospiraceae bacterium]
MENIIQNMAYAVAKWSVEDNDEDQIEIVTYGITLIIESIYKMIILIIIAFLTHKVYETLVVIGSFCGLRLLAGGIHCKTSFGCTLTMIFIWFSGIMSAHIYIPDLLIAIMLCLSLAVVFIYAPAATKNNPITNPKIRTSKKAGAVIMICVQMLICLRAMNMDNLPLANMISVPIFIEAVSVLLLRLVEGKPEKQ